MTENWLKIVLFNFVCTLLLFKGTNTQNTKTTQAHESQPLIREVQAASNGNADITSQDQGH